MRSQIRVGCGHGVRRKHGGSGGVGLRPAGERGNRLFSGGAGPSEATGRVGKICVVSQDGDGWPSVRHLPRAGHRPSVTPTTVAQPPHRVHTPPAGPASGPYSWDPAGTSGGSSRRWHQLGSWPWGHLPCQPPPVPRARVLGPRVPGGCVWGCCPEPGWEAPDPGSGLIILHCPKPCLGLSKPLPPLLPPRVTGTAPDGRAEGRGEWGGAFHRSELSEQQACASRGGVTAVGRARASVWGRAGWLAAVAAGQGTLGSLGTDHARAWRGGAGQAGSSGYVWVQPAWPLRGCQRHGREGLGLDLGVSVEVVSP